MDSNLYTILKDAFLPFICVWVYKGEEIIIKKVFIKNILSIDKTLRFENEVMMGSSRPFLRINHKQENIEPIKDQPDFIDNVPNKSMLNKRKKVRTK
jgi:hypothetical protein